MNTTLNYVPTHVGPTRLEQALASAPELSDESKTKVCIIEDMTRLGKLMEYKPMTPETFDTLYDMSIGMLEACQHNMQIKWNTREYHGRIFDQL